MAMSILAQCLVKKIGTNQQTAHETVVNYRGDWPDMEAEAYRFKAQQ
jgi:hypothetical protein